MGFLSKKHLRYLTYLLGILALRYLILELHAAARVGVTPTQKVISPDSLVTDELTGKDDQVVINVGKVECFHIGKLWEYCYKEREVTAILEDSYAERRIIRKDLRGSLGYNWFGTSEYLFYDALPLTFVPVVKDEVLKGISMVTSLAGSNGDKVVDGLHISLTPFSMAKINAGELVISEINVLFGEDCVDPRSDWHLDKSWKLRDARFPSYVTYKYLTSRKLGDGKLSLNVREDGKFKIVQLADLHYATGKNECRDEYPKHTDCEADSKTINFIEKVLDIESPDMVVYTGDQIMGDQSIQDSETSLLKALAPVIERKIPWALIWGNHDDEGSLNRWELSEIVRTLPFSLFIISPKDTKDNSFGVGNYVHQVFDLSDSKALITLYFLDSHKYSKTGKVYPGYDWIKEAQWDYLRQIHDDRLRKSNSKDAANQLSMAFFHIPLPEYLNLDSQKVPGTKNPIVGSLKEGVTAPKYNSGGINTLEYLGVDVTSCGHDHCNDYCLLDDSTSSKTWLCFGGGAGEGGYAGYGGTERRIRTFEFDTREGNIGTWKRLNGSPSETFDHQLVVKHGAPNVE